MNIYFQSYSINVKKKIFKKRGKKKLEKKEKT